MSTGRPGLIVDRGRREVQPDGESLSLTNREFVLLDYLVVHSGRTMTGQERVSAGWARVKSHLPGVTRTGPPRGMLRL